MHLADSYLQHFRRFLVSIQKGVSHEGFMIVAYGWMTFSDWALVMDIPMVMVSMEFMVQFV